MWCKQPTYPRPPRPGEDKNIGVNPQPTEAKPKYPTKENNIIFNNIKFIHNTNIICSYDVHIKETELTAIEVDFTYKEIDAHTVINILDNKELTFNQIKDMVIDRLKRV